MPELPEVEVIRQRILPRVIGRSVVEVIVRNPNLRRPVSPKLAAGLPGQALRDIARRGKYMLLRFTSGTVILHLGMTGFLQAVDDDPFPRLEPFFNEPEFPDAGTGPDRTLFNLVAGKHDAGELLAQQFGYRLLGDEQRILRNLMHDTHARIHARAQ